MADGLEDVGGVAISIDGDYSALAAAFSESETLAASSGQAIAASFTDGVSSANELTTAVQQTGAAAVTAGEQMNLFAGDVDSIPFADASGQLNLFTDELEPLTTGLTDVAGAGDTAAAGVDKFGAAEEAANPHTHEAAAGASDLLETLLKFAGIEIGIGMLKEFVGEAIETYAAVQKAQIALTALTGSATEAATQIEGLKDLALSDALSFPSLVAADQKMVALGIDTKAIKPALEAAGNAAAATGNNFENITGAIDKMAESGKLSSRQLIQMGLNLDDLAAVMGKSAGEVKDAFAEMDPTERVEVINTALGKFAGVALQTADSVSGQFQNLKTQTEFAMEGVGDAIAPAVSSILTLASTLINEGAAAYREMIGTVTTFTATVTAAVQPVLDFVGTLDAVKSSAGPAGTAVSGFITFLKDYNFYADIARGVRYLGDSISYLSGTIPNANVMAQAQTDRLNELNKTGTASTAVIKQLADAQTASVVAHRLAAGAVGVYKDALVDAQREYDKTLASWQKGIATNGDLILAQNALAGAQKQYNDTLTEQPDMVKPMRLFHDSLTAVASEQVISTAVTEAQNVKLKDLMLNLGLANQHLVDEIDHYKAASAAGSDLTLYTVSLNKALAEQQSAQKALNAVTGDWAKVANEAPSLQPMFDASTKSITAGFEALQKFLPAAQAPAQPVQSLTDDFKALGLQIDANTGLVETKAIDAFDDLWSHGELTLQGLEAAWGKVSGAINKMAQVDMPGALAKYQEYIDLLVKSGASEYQVQQAITAKLGMEIKYAEQSGADATQAIAQLTNIQLAQDVAKDKATAFGTAYTDVLHDISGGFQTIGKDIADNIVEGKNWSDVWHGFMKDLEKEILEQLIGIAFKTLGDTVAKAAADLLGIGKTAVSAASTATTAAVDATGAVAAAGKTAADTVTSTASTAASAVGSVGSSVMSTIGAIGSAVGALATIFTIFQNAQQETTLNAIEHNTRYEEIIIEQTQQAVWWPMFENTTYMVGTLEDISQHLNGILATDQVWLPFLGDVVAHLLVLSDVESETNAMAVTLSTWLPYLKSISDGVSGLDVLLAGLGSSAAATASTTADTRATGRRGLNASALNAEDFAPIAVPTAASSAAAGTGGITLNVDLSNFHAGSTPMKPADVTDAVFNAANRLMRTSGARY